MNSLDSATMKVAKNMKTYILSMAMLISANLYAIDCPADSSYHIDLRTLLPNGSPNPTFNQVIATGLCGCVGFTAELSGIEEDSTLTLSLLLLDNEPIRGTQIDIFHDAGNSLSYDQGGNVVKGDKLENLDDPTTPTVIETMTVLANEMDGFVRVMAYSTSRANTTGDGMEGSLFHLTFKAVNGLAALPATISFGLGSLDLPGTSMDPEILNVACSFPDTSNMVSFSTTNLSVMSENGIPLKYNLSQLSLIHI